MRKILLLGKSGQVGWELHRALSSSSPLPNQLFAYDRAGLDLTDQNAVRQVIRTVQPNIIINAAAYTAVDRAEAEHELALLINGHLPAVLAEEALHLDTLLVHYSTDYVFDGKAASPYHESDLRSP
jgi:dTDP-4-dehydrorhamnose reductase